MKYFIFYRGLNVVYHREFNKEQFESYMKQPEMKRFNNINKMPLYLDQFPENSIFIMAGTVISK